MKSLSRSSLLAIVSTFIFMLANPANAWGNKVSVNRPRSFASPSKPKCDGSSLGYKSGIEEEDNLNVYAAAISSALPVKSELPSKWELPRHSPPADDAMRERLLWDTEMTLGRVAMVAALFLLVGEIFTGQSMTDQVTSFFV